jgi:hypothetical protein
MRTIWFSLLPTHTGTAASAPEAVTTTPGIARQAAECDVPPESHLTGKILQQLSVDTITAFGPTLKSVPSLAATNSIEN